MVTHSWVLGRYFLISEKRTNLSLEGEQLTVFAASEKF